MRIGLMLRSIDEDQGIGIYTRNLVPRLLARDPNTEYVLIYRTPRFLGKFASCPNATEVVLRTPTKPLWDQVGVPLVARRYDVDLIFNTKFTVPFGSGRPTAMMLHGSMWFTHPEFHNRLDIAYVRAFMPRYCAKADHLISNSELTTNDFIRFVGLPRGKITTVHLAAGEWFKPVTDTDERERVRRKYGLPPKFILTVTKYFPGKNIPVLFEAYRQLPRERRGALVLVGRDVAKYVDDAGLRGTPLGDEIITPGWVDQRDLPAIYGMADLFAFPSRYEEFGIPVVEAMASGCPVVTSTTAAMPEISGGAALLADPNDAAAIAAAMLRVLEEPGLRESLIARGIERARAFSWERHADSTIEVLHRTARQGTRAVSPVSRERAQGAGKLGQLT